MIRKQFAALVVTGLLLSLLGCVRPVLSDVKVTPLPSPLPRLPTLPGSSPTPNTASSTESALATATLLPTPSTPTAAGARRVYAVAFISAGGLLNVRSGPSTDNPILETLAPHAAGLVGTGKEQEVSGSRWVEIQRADGTTGWVNGDFVTEQEDAAQFCNDSRVPSLLDSFVAAVNGQDGKALASLASPTHGLTIQYRATSPAITLASQDEVSQIFSSSTSYDWVTGSGNGQEVKGTFKDTVLPLLRNVTDGTPTRHCNLLQSGASAGGATAQLDWPFEYVNLNFMALYRPAVAGQEQDWRTWAVGIEFVNGVPYVAVLVQYNWEG